MVSLLTVLFHFRWNAATGSPWSTSLRKQNKTSNTCDWLLKISIVYRQIESLNFMDFFTIKVGAIWYGEMLGKREALSLPVSLFRGFTIYRITCLHWITIESTLPQINPNKKFLLDVKPYRGTTGARVFSYINRA